jgi:hypothetical protein
MTQLPVDIWWIILKKFWKSYCLVSFNPGNHKNYENAKRSYLYEDVTVMGTGITNDLYLMRTLCKTTKKMADKYSNRYIYGWESGKVPKHFLIFPYEK